MTTKTIRCPACGAADAWQDPKRLDRHLCQYCGCVFTDSEASAKAKSVKPVEVKLKTEVAKPEPDETDQTPEQNGKMSFGEWASVGFIVVVFGLIIWGLVVLFKATIKAEYYTGTINTLGQYTIPPLTCPDGSQGIELEYGFNKEPPILQVFPGTPGKDRWQISPSVAAQVSVHYVNTYSTTYMWVHCVNSQNKPEYYMTGSNSDLPKDGMQVVFKPSQ